MAHHHGGSSSSLSGMDMGMDMTSTTMFQPVNKSISRLFWYLVVTVVAVGLLGNILAITDSWLRKRRLRNGSNNPTVPTSWFWQLDATTRTIFRELSYPQGWYIKSGALSWFTPPSLGKCLMILGYWITITIMLTANSITNITEAYYFERIGFRAAWVSVMQVPLIIILAGRTNVIGFLVGSSYERLNWAHRWISRTLLVCVAVHSGFFLREWIRADFLALELELLPVVRYGLGAGGLLLWMNLSGLPFFRHFFYEFFVLQHLASIAVFIWLLYRHVPSYAMHFVWLSIGFLAFDRVVRLVWLFYRNVRVISNRGLGYEAELHPSPGGVTRVVIKDVSFRWTAGQHVYIWIPQMLLPEFHPFTISNACPSPSTKNATNDIELQIRAHSGFSRRLLNLAQAKSTPESPLTVRCFLQGPYGSFPQWNTYDTLLLIAASTGASFTLPIFESILQDPSCVRRLHFLLLVRERPQCSCYLSRLRVLAREHKQLEVSIHVAITSPDDSSATNDGDAWEGPLGERCCCGGADKCFCGAEEAQEFILRNSSDEKSGNCCAVEEVEDEQQSSRVEIIPSPAASTKESPTDGSSAASINSRLEGKPVPLSVARVATNRPADVSFVSRRPALDGAIRDAVEHAWGETGVVVCGGKALSGYVRNEVARLSDERAVHKGSGAQGIALHVEEFGF